jgi:membrane protein YqaA with SNARE-associated domain
MTVLAAAYWSSSILRSLLRLGGLGLFIMGILDSSFLFLPFGNDLLLILMIASNRDSLIWILYVLLSALGSVVGALLVDLVMRKMGEEGLERFVKPDKLKRLKAKMEKSAGWAVLTATLIPPPFPFTAVVLTASALQTSRWKILLAVFAGRVVRFTGEAALALYFGRRVVSLMESDVITYLVYGFIGIAVIGSAYSIYRWITNARPGSRMETNPATE